MKTNPPKRPTPGKPPLVEGSLAVRVNITLTAEQRERLRQLGGSAWIRRQIDEAGVDDETVADAEDDLGEQVKAFALELTEVWSI